MIKFREKKYLSVIDLGSRSIKFLKGPRKHKPYNPKDFFNTGERVDPRKVDDILRKYIELTKDSDLIIIATEWYRNNLWKVKELEKNLGINIKVLTPEEEAKGTLDSWMYTGSKLFQEDHELIIVDQGGKSTEIVIPCLDKWWSIKNENRNGFSKVTEIIKNNKSYNFMPVCTGSDFQGRHGEIIKTNFLGFDRVMVNRTGLRYGIYYQNAL